MKYRLGIVVIATLILTCILVSAQNPSSSTANAPVASNVSTAQTHSVTPEAAGREEDRITREVRHELLMLPYYSVFDDLEYQVQGNTVVLKGLVVNPATKNDAEGSVKKIEGVDKVVNQIEIAPPSSSDDQIRRETYRAIFGTGGMYRYAMSAVPSIHIIVKNGHVALKGVVDNAMDKQLAVTRANSVPGVFSVTDDLMVINPGKGSESAKKK